MTSLMNMMVIFGLGLIGAEAGGGGEFDLAISGIILIVGGLSGMLAKNNYVGTGVSIVLGMMYLVMGRNFIKRKIVSVSKKTNIDKLIDKQGYVVRTITPDTPGLVRLDDEDWRATCEEVVYEKEKIEVVEIEGVSLKVKKIK